MVTFKYGSLSAFKNLETKDPDALYVLDNHQLYKGADLVSAVRTVNLDSDLPETPTDEMRETYFISLESGRIKYVTYEKTYIDISSICIENIVLSDAFIQQLIEKISGELEEITMPTLVVTGEGNHTLEWKASNVTSFKSFTVS